MIHVAMRLTKQSLTAVRIPLAVVVEFTLFRIQGMLFGYFSNYIYFADHGVLQKKAGGENTFTVDGRIPDFKRHESPPIYLLIWQSMNAQGEMTYFFMPRNLLALVLFLLQPASRVFSFC
jgi:hypothetical protein